MSVDSDRRLLAAYDSAAAALDELLTSCERHTADAGAPWPAVDPVQLVSEVAAIALERHGSQDGSAFPRHLAAAVMVTMPGRPPRYDDVTIGGRLRRRLEGSAS
jgi:hypothetical protein